MKKINPFDTKLEAQMKIPDGVREAAIELTDTLDLCWAAAQTVFEQRATPEHALTLLPMFMQRSDEKRQQALAQHAERMDAAIERNARAKRRKQAPKEG